jgi:hypothetical protein
LIIIPPHYGSGTNDGMPAGRNGNHPSQGRRQSKGNKGWPRTRERRNVGYDELPARKMEVSLEKRETGRRNEVHSGA